MNCPKCGLINTGNTAVGLAMPQCMCHWQVLAPPRQPLSDEEIDELSRTMVKGNKSVNWLCRAIEAAHGIGEPQ